MLIRAYLHNATWRRIVNLLRCRLSYALSCAGIVRVRHLPEFISVEPADWCMLRCAECPVGQASGGRARHTLSPGLFRRLLDQTGDRLHTVQFFFQGEPLLCRQLPELIAEAAERGIVSIVSTNAQLLTPQLAEQLLRAGLNKIIVSIDGLTQSSYEVYRAGGSLERALAGLRAVADARERTGSRVEIELQCLRLRSNEHEWERFRREYRRLGATKLSMKTAQIIDFRSGSDLLPSDSRYVRYRIGKDGEWHRKKAYRNRCARLWSGCVVDAEGQVLPCCFDKRREHVLGRIEEQSFQDIWFGEEADRFRKTIVQRREAVEMCKNCTE